MVDHGQRFTIDGGVDGLSEAVTKLSLAWNPSLIDWFRGKYHRQTALLEFLGDEFDQIPANTCVFSAISLG